MTNTSFKPKCNDCVLKNILSVSTNDKKPIFSFQYIQENHGLKDCPENDKIALINKLFELSQVTWGDIFQANRHGMGKEIIDHKSIKAPVPSCVKEDTNILAIRYNGKAPMIGFRENEIFHILWIDHNFKLYKHSHKKK
jgi:hypothetical protein